MPVSSLNVESDPIIIRYSKGINDVRVMGLMWHPEY
jgi:hypothetical protein